MPDPHHPGARPRSGAEPPNSSRRLGTFAGEGPVIAAVAVGGALGACARHGVGRLWSSSPPAFPWTTLGVNVIGCALIGVLMVLVTEVWTPHRLVRPFLGTGVLGGFTTFSAYAADIRHLVVTGHAHTGIAYLALTLTAALIAVWCATATTRHLVSGRRT